MESTQYTLNQFKKLGKKQNQAEKGWLEGKDVVI